MKSYCEIQKINYLYFFDSYFDIPEGIPEDKYTEEEAHKFAIDMVQRYDSKEHINKIYRFIKAKLRLRYK